MSHYAVAVFSRKDQDIDDLLAPYNENMEVEPYVLKTRQEVIDEYRKDHEGAAGKSDQECFDAYVESWYGSMPNLDDEGNILSTYNPKSKWDWYVIGGRFSGMLKDGHRGLHDCLTVKLIDFSRDEDKYNDAIRFWEVIIDGDEQRDGENFRSFYNVDYLKGRYKTKENYATIMSQFSTYAVVTPDGEWHAPGEMGWFGCSSENDDEYNDWESNYKKRFIDTADPDWILTIVDCHI